MFVTRSMPRRAGVLPWRRSGGQGRALPQGAAKSEGAAARRGGSCGRCRRPCKAGQGSVNRRRVTASCNPAGVGAPRRDCNGIVPFKEHDRSLHNIRPRRKLACRSDCTAGLAPRRTFGLRCGHWATRAPQQASSRGSGHLACRSRNRGAAGLSAGLGAVHNEKHGFSPLCGIAVSAGAPWTSWAHADVARSVMLSRTRLRRRPSNGPCASRLVVSKLGSKFPSCLANASRSPESRSRSKLGNGLFARRRTGRCHARMPTYAYAAKPQAWSPAATYAIPCPTWTIGKCAVTPRPIQIDIPCRGALDGRGCPRPHAWHRAPVSSAPGIAPFPNTASENGAGRAAWRFEMRKKLCAVWERNGAALLQSGLLWRRFRPARPT